VEDTRKQELPISEELEIVELDERLDMAFDPLGLVISRVPTNGNCNNSQCCGKAL
jgi:hypothetical protein